MTVRNSDRDSQEWVSDIGGLIRTGGGTKEKKRWFGKESSDSLPRTRIDLL